MFKLFSAKPQLPLNEDDRTFVDNTFLWLAEQFSWAPLLRPVVTPTADHFPAGWEATDDELDDLFARVCSMMAIAPEKVTLSVFAEDEDPVQSLVPTYEHHHSGPAGLFFDKKHKNRLVVAVSERTLEDPGSLVATLAHELGHVHLLGDKRLSPDHPDHERVTDLLTIFFGLGIFTANSAFQFSQWQDGNWQGWSSKRLGYLDEPALGYALAAYAYVRGEEKPRWSQHLAHGVLTYMKQSERYLLSNSLSKLPRRPSLNVEPGPA